MCGIFGVIYKDSNQKPEQELLLEAGAVLQHRGPDGTGVYVDGGVGLVHARLSLLDLSERSNQPFWDKTRRYVLVYNGEIYNFKEIRSELEERGLIFSTTSDTEVLLEGLITFGAEALLPKLEGMFAFALWDSQEKTLLIARDRFGIKPLYILASEWGVAFSSEVKAFKILGALEPEPFIVSAYLEGFGGPTRGKSFFKGIEIFSPGTVRTYRYGDIDAESEFFQVYDFLNDKERDSLSALNSEQIIDRFDDLLSMSVQKHLIADAPVGALCSGGIDSSLVLAMAARAHGNLAIFHADVKGPLSEFSAAKQLADHLRLDMQTVEVRDEDFVRYLPTVLRHYEYPFAYHPNSIPFFLVAQLARQSGVKAVLSGEGADENFLGYGGIALTDLRTRYLSLINSIGRGIRRIPKIGREIWPVDSSSRQIAYSLFSNFEVESDLKRVSVALHSSAQNLRPRDVRSLEWLGYHLRTLLHRNDMLGMASGIEARFPYLDHALVGAAVNLNYRYKVRPTLSASDPSHPFLQDKWVIRKIATRYLPRSLSHRRKRGFPVNAYDRLTVDDNFFINGFVAQLFRLTTNRQMDLLHSADQNFRFRMLLLEVWGRMFILDQSESNMLDALHPAVSFR